MEPLFSRIGPQNKEGHMAGKAAKITITEEQQTILQQIASAKTASVQHTQRAKIMLLAFDGMLNMDIAKQVEFNRLQVGVWRQRWAASFDALVAIECRETNAALTRAIEQVLSDAHVAVLQAHSPPRK